MSEFRVCLNMFLGTSLFFIVLMSPLIIFQRRCLEKSEIVEIGGCDNEGCGVRLANGKYSQLHKPVIGLELCVEYEWSLRWFK